MYKRVKDILHTNYSLTYACMIIRISWSCFEYVQYGDTHFYYCIGALYFNTTTIIQSEVDLNELSMFCGTQKQKWKRRRERRIRPTRALYGKLIKILFLILNWFMIIISIVTICVLNVVRGWFQIQFGIHFLRKNIQGTYLI